MREVQFHAHDRCGFERAFVDCKVVVPEFAEGDKLQGERALFQGAFPSNSRKVTMSIPEGILSRPWRSLIKR